MRWLAVVLAVGVAAVPHAAATSLPREQALEDLGYLRSALQTLHAGLRRYTTTAEIEEAFLAAGKAFGPRVSQREVFVAAAGLSPAIRDGHTRFRYSEELAREAEDWPLLPLQVRIVGDRLHVVRDCSASGGSAGREILAIEGIAAPTLAQRVMALQPRDGWNETGPRYRLGRSLAFSEALAALLAPRPTWSLSVASEEGPRLVRLPGRPLRLLRRCAAPPPLRPQGLQFLDDGRVAEIVLPSFVPELGETYESWFASLVARRTQALLIDLRGNGGGLDSNGSRLFAHLTRTRFRYYDAIVVNTLEPPAPFDGFASLLRPWRIERDALGRLQFTGHSCLGEQAPAAPGFSGAVVGLIDGGTFSAASEFAAVATSQRRATFVGEETGGAANGNTAGVSADVTLPHSGVRVQIPLMRYEVAAPGLPVGRGVLPGHEVRALEADEQAGRDPARERALSLARASVSRKEIR